MEDKKEVRNLISHKNVNHHMETTSDGPSEYGAPLGLTVGFGRLFLRNRTLCDCPYVRGTLRGVWIKGALNLPVFRIPAFGIPDFGIPGFGTLFRAESRCGFSLPSESLPSESHFSEFPLSESLPSEFPPEFQSNSGTLNQTPLRLPPKYGVLALR